jgi:hypothetical protein
VPKLEKRFVSMTTTTTAVAAAAAAKADIGFPFVDKAAVNDRARARALNEGS